VVPHRLRPVVAGSYLVIGGGFMLWVAAFRPVDAGLVRFILLAAGGALALLGSIEILTALRRS
jgi:hypothetical protein